MDNLPPMAEINYFTHAREESYKSEFRCQVGACLVIGKSIIKGHNKRKTHPKFANPSIHIKTSIHAELQCLLKANRFNMANALLYVYRETADKKPAMAKPCEHCTKFLKRAGIKEVYYSVGYYPYYEKEIL